MTEFDRLASMPEPTIYRAYGFKRRAELGTGQQSYVRLHTRPPFRPTHLLVYGKDICGHLSVLRLGGKAQLLSWRSLVTYWAGLELPWPLPNEGEDPFLFETDVTADAYKNLPQQEWFLPTVVAGHRFELDADGSPDWLVFVGLEIETPSRLPPRKFSTELDDEALDAFWYELDGACKLCTARPGEPHLDFCQRRASGQTRVPTR